MSDSESVVLFVQMINSCPTLSVNNSGSAWANGFLFTTSISTIVEFCTPSSSVTWKRTVWVPFFDHAHLNSAPSTSQSS